MIERDIQRVQAKLQAAVTRAERERWIRTLEALLDKRETHCARFKHDYSVHPYRLSVG